ncbi:Crp/Fnr family transcriptional regulator [Algiphilus sp.]|uniref:Crp/Fnr family transcriptional regulator n=2 Tax=Algiphilus sp. TaxID=1872431 RepID=UPI003BAA222D
MAMQDSCIIQHFGNLADLTAAEVELLQSLELNPRTYPAGEIIRSSGARADVFFTLNGGWAYAARNLSDGERQVLDLFLPGQIMGLRELGYDDSLSDFVALTEIRACPFPKTRLTEVFDQAPRLADLFMLTLAREQSMLVERIVNIGRRPADRRLAHFVVEMKLRAAPDDPDFELPMNQEVIGDTLGLSSVHVSRTFKSLEALGLVLRQGNRIQVGDFQALVDYAEFNPTYLQRQVAWVRQAAAEGV